MARLLGVVGVCGMLALAGCEGSQKPAVQAQRPAQPRVKLAPSTPLDEKKEELGEKKTWHPEWDAMVERALPADMLGARAARAVRRYCPRFAEETKPQKREFWAYIFQGISAAEASLNPTSDVQHVEAAVDTIDPVTHRPSRQEGLLQLKYEDAERYGCDFDWERDRRLPGKDPGRSILRPANNLECGVKIMENQIVTLHRPLVTRMSYWATLQPGTGGFRVFAEQMANVPAACGLRERRGTEIASR